jgi:hypothetical protein
MTPPLLRIASARGVPGMAAGLAQDLTGALFVLANYHVVFGGGATGGDRVWAVPAEDDHGGGLEAVCLGRARTGRIGRVTFQGDTYFVDCALVELADKGSFAPWLQCLMNGPWPTEIGAAEPGMSVFKNGATTGFTEGVLVDVAYPDYPFIDGRCWTAPGQLLVDCRDPELNFSAAGDSGAALLDNGGRILGLLWGSNTSGQGVACPIQPVLDCLGVTLTSADQPARRCA